MPSVKFEYSLEKDIGNVLRVINVPPRNDPADLERPLGSLSRELVAKVREQSDASVKEQLTRGYVSDLYEKNKVRIDQQVDLFSKKWAKINDEYFKRLEKVIGLPLPENVTYFSYLTSAGSCPFSYKEGWFMVRIEDDAADAIAAHELLHFGFIRNYSLYCRDVLKLIPKEFGTIQEATTFLLNEEMSDLLSRPDYGYKEHQQLRKALAEEWKKNKDFKNLLEYYAKIKESYQ